MKVWIPQKAKHRKLFILLFSIISFFGFSDKTFAQGWTFTFQLAQSGPCGGGALPVLPTFPNFGFPTQNQCESLRQTILGISASARMYDSHGNYIGDCKVYYTCTPCTGSDVATSGQVNPGDVSFDGQSQGKPFFTTHQSKAFEDWARDYKALLESYGITSILGNKLYPHPIPLTGDKNIDKLYDSLSVNFNPPVPAPPRNPPSQDPNVVELSGKKGVVKILNQPDEDKALKVTAVPVPVPGEIKEGHEYIDFGREALVTLVGVAPKQYSYLGIAIIDLYAEDAKALLDCLGGNNCPSTSTILTNAASQTATDMAMQGLGDLGGFASGQLFSSIADKSMIKKGVLPGIEGIVKEGRIAEIGEAHFSIVSAGVETGKKILNAWGVTTIYDDEKK